MSAPICYTQGLKFAVIFNIAYMSLAFVIYNSSIILFIIKRARFLHGIY